MPVRKRKSMERHGTDVESNRFSSSQHRLSQLGMMLEQNRVEYKLNVAHRRINKLERTIELLVEATGIEIPKDKEEDNNE